MNQNLFILLETLFIKIGNRILYLFIYLYVYIRNKFGILQSQITSITSNLSKKFEELVILNMTLP